MNIYLVFGTQLNNRFAKVHFCIDISHCRSTKYPLFVRKIQINARLWPTKRKKYPTKFSVQYPYKCSKPDVYVVGAEAAATTTTTTLTPLRSFCIRLLWQHNKRNSMEQCSVKVNGSRLHLTSRFNEYTAYRIVPWKFTTRWRWCRWWRVHHFRCSLSEERNNLNGMAST